MSGLEILGAASAVLGFVETAVSLIGRLRDAYDRQTELSSVLDTYRRELISTRDILQIVRDEDALQTAAVGNELVEIENVSTKIVELLKTLTQEKGSVRQFTHQLVHGSRDERKLSDIFEQLGRAKFNLMMRMQAAHVGLTRKLDNSIAVNTSIVERVNRLLEPVLEEGQGLKIAKFLHDRCKNNDNDTILLDDSDVLYLQDGTAQEAHRLSGDVRIVMDNLTEDQALQINGPIGQEGWREVAHLEIRNNKASGNAMQVNHGMSIEAFTQMLALRSQK
ncbi:hypothetical protein FLONG3_7651 [Fusarium longipes]|uniref:Fungal N-terminal domain-containing protein n=1 Tax=Fusarium longipes TaxID=694270 RepID=A0A395SCA1_9HYPO|nr:hypothetical protein FLONG3_7651 [Fusarium longipes]